LLVLFLGNNQLSGAIPNFNLSNLQYLWLSNNQLSDTIPTFNSPDLKTLRLDANQLSGCISPKLKKNCPLIGAIGGSINDNPNLSTQDWAAYWNKGVGACEPCTISATISGGKEVCITETLTVNVIITLKGELPFVLKYRENKISKKLVINDLNYILTFNPSETTTFYLDSLSNKKCRIALKDSTTFTLYQSIQTSVIDTICSSDNKTYSVTLTATIPNNNALLIDGKPILGNSFVSSPIASGEDYTFSVSEAKSPCGATLVTGKHTCPIPSCVLNSKDIMLKTTKSNNEFSFTGEKIGLFLEETYTTYLWSNGKTDATIEVKRAGTYKVTVTDAKGCTGNSSIELFQKAMNDGPTGIILDDSENGIFHIPRLDQDPCNCPNNEFYVINRWGEMVYSAKPFDNSKGWNGYSGKDNNYGAALPVGTYYTFIKINIGQGEVHTGEITILRKE
jgi:CHU_C Type IX secretion signal domain